MNTLNGIEVNHIQELPVCRSFSCGYKTCYQSHFHVLFLGRMGINSFGLSELAYLHLSHVETIVIKL